MGWGPGAAGISLVQGGIKTWVHGNQPDAGYDWEPGFWGHTRRLSSWGWLGSWGHRNHPEPLESDRIGICQKHGFMGACWELGATSVSWCPRSHLGLWEPVSPEVDQRPGFMGALWEAGATGLAGVGQHWGLWWSWALTPLSSTRREYLCCTVPAWGKEEEGNMNLSFLCYHCIFSYFYALLRFCHSSPRI